MAININEIININDRVVSKTIQGISFNMMGLTSKGRIPSSFPALTFRNELEVANFFGDNSEELKCAKVYFKSFDGSDKKPDNIIFGLLMNVDKGAWYMGNTPSTLDILKAITDGSFTIKASDSSGTIQATSITGVNLSAATSLSQVASIITTSLTTASLKVNCVYDNSVERFVFENTVIGENSKFDFIESGTTGTDLASLLGMLKSENPVISNGYQAMTGDKNMEYIKNYFENFISLSVVDSVSNDLFIELAKWVDSQGTRFVLLPYTTDIRAKNKNDISTIAYLCKDYSGVAPVFGNNIYSFFLGGIGASIDFSKVNGVTTFAFRKQIGLPTVVDNTEEYNNLIENGYNCYAVFGNVANKFDFLQEGRINGSYQWIDAYYNQVWLKDNMINGIATIMQNNKRIQYSQKGFEIVNSELEAKINEGLTNGVIEKEIVLDEDVSNQINRDAGKIITPTLFEKGYVILIDEPTQEMRNKRVMPNVSVWYTYSGAVHKINIDLAQVQ